MTAGTLTRVVGALAEASGLDGVALHELVRVGHRRLLGEVLRITGDDATLQVFEDTTGIRVGEPVTREHLPLAIELGPGLLGQVIDGIGRPLARLAERGGTFIEPGEAPPTLAPDRRFTFEPRCGVGDRRGAGDVLGVVADRGGIEVRVLVPPGRAGRIVDVRSGEVTVLDKVVWLDDGEPLTLSHRWPVRRPRPVQARLQPTVPFLTGQRIFDFLFPVAEGGTVAVPGGFGTGKTVIEQALAKFGEADIVVYIGCGERGNEMAEVLHEFSALVDPRTGRPVMDRTVLVVNTSNMPVAARESSIYVGLTVAEYYRDMGGRLSDVAGLACREAARARRPRHLPGHPLPDGQHHAHQRGLATGW